MQTQQHPQQGQTNNRTRSQNPTWFGKTTLEEHSLRYPENNFFQRDFCFAQVRTATIEEIERMRWIFQRLKKEQMAAESGELSIPSLRQLAPPTADSTHAQPTIDPARCPPLPREWAWAWAWAWAEGETKDERKRFPPSIPGIPRALERRCHEHDQSLCPLILPTYQVDNSFMTDHTRDHSEKRELKLRNSQDRKCRRVIFCLS